MPGLLQFGGGGRGTGGLALTWATGQLTRRIEDVPSSVMVQFISTYGVWVVAERAGLSPILTMVIYAMTLAGAFDPQRPCRPAF
jgi:NhaP-type Na+/H+ or K+/H+ antiporter